MQNENKKQLNNELSKKISITRKRAGIVDVMLCLELNDTSGKFVKVITKNLYQYPDELQMLMKYQNQLPFSNCSLIR